MGARQNEKRDSGDAFWDLMWHNARAYFLNDVS